MHLRLSDSNIYTTHSCIDLNPVLLKISETCKNLKELDLSYSYIIEDKGFSYLEGLNNLEHLNVDGTGIRTEHLCKILQNNQRMRQLSTDWINDAVLIELENSCRDLEVIDSLLCARDLTSQGINALANCKNLQKVKLDLFDYSVTDDSLFKLLSSYQNLQEVYLFDAVLTDHRLELLAQCKNLKKLHLFDAELDIPDNCSVILKQCSKLQEFYFIFCNDHINQLVNELVNQWKERYPHASVYIRSMLRESWSIWHSRYLLKAFPGQIMMEVVQPIINLLNSRCSVNERCETLTALCNLASVNDSMRKHVFKEAGFEKIEDYMHDDNKTC
ncbi:uncharacterized protein [Temnothorax nylanderi]|uniref:uncharacterized protein isoform X1 n=1 Tax=Temnothorax nylanderi TaxID=102681 RepID=UPI003A891431